MGLFDFFREKRAVQTKKFARRSYTAAATGRLFADFVANTLSADSEIRPALRRVRDRCRDVARNNDYAKRYLQMIETNVVGDQGVRIQVRARNSDQSLDTVGNAIIERQWDYWGRRGVPTMDGKMSWLDCQRMFISNVARDGECIVRMVETRDNPFGFAIQFIESDYLDEEYNMAIGPNGNQIRMGVEIDNFGKPLAYWLLAAHPGDQQFSKAATVKRIRVPADEILHIFLSDRSGQTRGFPWMATALTRLKMLDGYEEAELVAARTAASKMGFFTSPDGDGYSGVDMEDYNAPIMEASPGTFEQLPKGMSFTPFDPQHPVSAFAEFEKAVLRGIASGLGVSYVSLANNLEGVSYSSIRQGTMEDRDHYRMLQQFMIEHFIDPIFRKWLTMAMSTNQVTIPVTKFDKFADNLIYRARGWNWVDPQKEINAHIIGLQNGITTMQDIASHYGRDVEEVFAQIDAERELAKQYGIETAFQPFGSKLPTNPSIQGGSDGTV